MSFPKKTSILIIKMPEANLELEALLDYLKHSRGCDLTGYKSSSLMRRLQYRMRCININSYQSYQQYLHSESDELPALLNDVLIKVTSFFRDQYAWDYLATEIIPKIITSKQTDEPIRVWSAGCATGQEIYSCLILLAEALGIESCLKRVKCFATDADLAAIRRAQRGTYTATEITGIPPALQEKYFQYTNEGFVFHPELRCRIIFCCHDLTRDAPMSKIDLLICRNVLIYFNLMAQQSILVRFHFSLKQTGFLFMGKAEAIITRRQLFPPVSFQHHVYAKGLNLEKEDYSSLITSGKSRLIKDQHAINSNLIVKPPRHPQQLLLKGVQSVST
ncbi:MAG: protein-glutamate O-methyltransferase CheR [Rhizonema sp. PD37]|nr:protein-glutamate O-methyltransferase CheR [Rhizonema sp. PD37]